MWTRYANSDGCDFCGYDLTGLMGVCPECGAKIQRLTERAKQVLVTANDECVSILTGTHPMGRVRRWWHLGSMARTIQPCHVLLGVVCGPRGIGYHAVLQCGVDPESLRRAVVTRLPPLGAEVIAPGTKLPLASMTRRLLRQAVRESRSLEDGWIGSEHLLLALCRGGDTVTQQSLQREGVAYEPVHRFVMANLRAVEREKERVRRDLMQ